MLKEFIDRIKISFCCKSKCSMNAELPIEVEEKKHYDYFTKKPKQFASTRSL